MQLREFLSDIATNYHIEDGLNTPTQHLLRNSSAALDSFVPLGIEINGGGGKGNATFTPWVGFFDPDETDNPQEGIYVVYIFSADLKTVVLTLNQGMEYLRKELGDSKARARLANDAFEIRSRFESTEIAELDHSMTLGSNGQRQKAYESANILSKTYSTASLPSEVALKNDFDHFMRLYVIAVGIKRELLQRQPGLIGSPSHPPGSKEFKPPPEFKPKDDGDYVVQIKAQQRVVTKKHETLVKRYGLWAKDHGFEPFTEHPIDLTLRKDQQLFIVEAKVIRLANSAEGVRGAIGQLSEYRFFLYPDQPEAKLVALFSESIGKAYIELLIYLDILPVWFSNGAWDGSPGARDLGLCD